MSFSAAAVYPTACASAFSYYIDWDDDTVSLLSVDSYDRRVHGTVSDGDLVGRTLYGNIVGYALIEGDVHYFRSGEQFCVDVIPGDCNSVEIQPTPLSSVLTVELDEVKVYDLADYGLPWTYTPEAYQDFCGDLEYFFDYTGCTGCDDWVSIVFDSRRLLDDRRELTDGAYDIVLSPSSGEQTAGTKYISFCAKIGAAFAVDYDEECTILTIIVEEAAVDPCDSADLTEPEHSYESCLTIAPGVTTPGTFVEAYVDVDSGCQTAYTVTHSLLDSEGQDLSWISIVGTTLLMNPTADLAGNAYDFWIVASSYANGLFQEVEYSDTRICVTISDDLCDAGLLDIVPSSSSSGFDAQLDETSSYSISAWSITPQS